MPLIPSEPTEPDPVPWLFPDPRGLAASEEVAAVGAELSAGTLLAGYRRGLFPMPFGDDIAWISPHPRGILTPRDVRIPRSLRRSCRRFTISVDQYFADVVDACADPRRPHGWITDDYRLAYRDLHRLGWAHSVEVHLGAEMVGGLFGVQVGGLFLAESKFHTSTDASKAAVVALCAIQDRDPPPGGRLVDVQWRTAHLARLGVVEWPRSRYLRESRRAMTFPPPLWASPPWPPPR